MADEPADSQAVVGAVAAAPHRRYRMSPPAVLPVLTDSTLRCGTGFYAAPVDEERATREIGHQEQR